EQTGSVDLVGRLQMLNQFGTAASGYHFRIASGGTWTLFREDDSDNDVTLASGTRAFGLNTFHRLSLSLSGTTIEAFVDGVRVGTATDSTFRSGNVALQVSKWQNAQFDNFSAVAVGGGGNVTTGVDSVPGTGRNQFNCEGCVRQHCTN